MHQNSSNQHTNLDEVEVLLEIEEWEMICPVCKGVSYLDGNWWECNKCWGSGKLDWIENVMGKERPMVGSGSSSTSSCSSTTPVKKLRLNFKKKGEINVNKNLTRSRTVQRLYKMFNKSKRGM